MLCIPIFLHSPVSPEELHAVRRRPESASEAVPAQIEPCPCLGAPEARARSVELMKFVNEPEAQADFDEVLEEAQKHPIVIRRQGNQIAALVGITACERLRADAVQSLPDLRTQIARDAMAAGLTEA